MREKVALNETGLRLWGLVARGRSRKWGDGTASGDGGRSDGLQHGRVAIDTQHCLEQTLGEITLREAWLQAQCAAPDALLALAHVAHDIDMQ